MAELSFPDFTKRRASKSKGSGKSGPDAIPEVKPRKTIKKTVPNIVTPVSKPISASWEIEDEELVAGACPNVHSLLPATSGKEPVKQGKVRG